MRLRSTLLRIAVLASTSAACSSGSPGAAADAGPTCGQVNASMTAAQACTLVSGGTAIFGVEASGEPVVGSSCDAFCGPLQAGGCTLENACVVPVDYATAYGVDNDAGGQPVTCPTWTGNVAIVCSHVAPVGGRGTEGVALLEEARARGPRVGAILAGRAYLEAVSVHAFERLERELAAHGAPAPLLRGARRAQRDEVRHTAMVSRLARRHGGDPRTPNAPAPSPARSLVAIAVENAVEGCVRETYGAVVNLVEARASSDPAVRRAMKSIAQDECRHAELAWEVAAWLRPRLTEAEREAVDAAMRDAVAELTAQDDGPMTRMLAERVWGAPSPSSRTS